MSNLALELEPSPTFHRAAGRPIRAISVRVGSDERVIVLDQSRRYVFGASRDADVPLDTANVVARHGALTFDGQRWQFEDLGEGGVSYVADGRLISGAQVPVVRVRRGCREAVAAGEVVMLGSRRALVELVG